MKSFTPTLERRHVFARPISFDLECPHCGSVDSIGRSRRPWKTFGHYNPITSKWLCPTCRRLFKIGLAIWPVSRTGNRQRGIARSADTIPSERELQSLRQLSGIVRVQSRGRGAPVNLIACPCLDRDDFDPACPFHAGEE